MRIRLQQKLFNDQGGRRGDFGVSYIFAVNILDANRLPQKVLMVREEGELPCPNSPIPFFGALV